MNDPKKKKIVKVKIVKKGEESATKRIHIKTKFSDKRLINRWQKICS